MFETIAIVGATGAVGRIIRQLLEEREFPYRNIRFLASKRSAGTTITFKGEEHVVEEMTPEIFAGIDLAIGSTPDETAKDFCPLGRRARLRRRRRERLLADGPEGAARGPRSEPRGDRRPSRPHQQPQLFDHANGRRHEAAPRLRPHPPRRRQHLPGDQRRRREGPGRSEGRRPRVPRRRRATSTKPSSTRSRSTSSRRSVRRSTRGTRAKK